jgi:hypothetical protein
MKTKRRIFSVILLTAIILLLVIPVQAAFDNRVLDGLVYIETEYVDIWGDIDGDRGTGFFVGAEGRPPRYIVTNFHVIENYLLAGINNGIIYIYYDQNTFDEAYHVEHNAQLDIALLRLINPTNNRAALPLKVVNPERAQGRKVYAVGFPAIVDAAVWRKSYFGKEDATVTDGVINRLSVSVLEGRQEIQHSATITGGNSGGPLVDDKGAVIGINTRTHTAGGNYNLAVNIDDALSMLHRNNVNPWVVLDDDGIPLILILAIAGGVIGLALAAVLIMLLTKKKPVPVPAAVSVPAEIPVPVGAGSMPARSAFIRSMAAQHNNISAPLGKTPVMIGRDASVCKIIFKEDTPGVSSKHCQIYFDGNNFILTDLGSSYGTFLMNGQKLDPNTPARLNARDYFYVASKDNTFLVDME